MNEIITGDCVPVLGAMPAGFADLVFADPPFNIGYEYDQYDDYQTRYDYLAFADQWLAAAVRALAPAGSLFLAIGDDNAAEYKTRLDGLGLTMRSWIVWHYTFGVHCERKFGRDHTHVLYYVRDPDRFTFNADAVRVPSARQAKYADKRANPKGRVPGDVWTFPRVCGTFRERNKFAHGCQIPEALMERVILAASNPGDVVLDPFAGSGTTLAVANRLGRRWLGIELSEKYAAGARERVNASPSPSSAPASSRPAACPGAAG